MSRYQTLDIEKIEADIEEVIQKLQAPTYDTVDLRHNLLHAHKTIGEILRALLLSEGD